MYDDKDIKIAGNRPSDSIKRNSLCSVSSDILSEAQVNSANKLGAFVAQRFSEASNAYSDATEDTDADMAAQRMLLLAFTVTAVLETYVENETFAGIAQKSFLDTVKNEYNDIFQYTSDTGAFTFYYLAYRRKIDVERRIGQTFAMLCGHDGDPVYQELGEVLFCWFSSVIKNAVEEFYL